MRTSGWRRQATAVKNCSGSGKPGGNRYCTGSGVWGQGSRECRIDGVNELAMSYLTRQLEPVRVEVQAENGAGSHFPQCPRLSYAHITVARPRMSYAVCERTEVLP
jgi:hypothetical protein